MVVVVRGADKAWVRARAVVVVRGADKVWVRARVVVVVREADEAWDAAAGALAHAANASVPAAARRFHISKVCLASR